MYEYSYRFGYVDVVHSWQQSLFSATPLCNKSFGELAKLETIPVSEFEQTYNYTENGKRKMRIVAYLNFFMYEKHS